MAYYADAEGGAHVPDPDRAGLIDLTRTLDTSTNTFYVVYPDDEDLEWFVSVSKAVSAFGGYEIHRYDPATSLDAVTTAADPNTIAGDLLDWINQR
ncbi:hypothetical protein [Antribacter gilvus]|uniref:hypothetical protein n=1 Tax=Antribacter gilvus TaxID=2304675 RepID=UPI000F798BF8|nr:hypothetical protein [Antribacter gilvus]